MIHRNEYGEGHAEQFCCYCGATADTVDHVPSKVFLDKPYNNDLPVVPCCQSCNAGFSLDEEFVAVLFECVKCQTFDPTHFRREKVRKIVNHSHRLISTIKGSLQISFDGHISIIPNDRRLVKVLTKLAAGHLRFEGLRQHFVEGDLKIEFYQDIHASTGWYQQFHTPIFSRLFPEVGSRAMTAGNIYLGGLIASRWMIVQEGLYEYCVAPDNSEVRIIVQDYFGVRAVNKETN